MKRICKYIDCHKIFETEIGHEKYCCAEHREKMHTWYGAERKR